jgi:hypothetical protein
MLGIASDPRVRGCAVGGDTFSEVQVREAGGPLQAGACLPGPGAGARGGGRWGGQGKQGQTPDTGGVAERRGGL